MELLLGSSSSGVPRIRGRRIAGPGALVSAEPDIELRPQEVDNFPARPAEGGTMVRLILGMLLLLFGGGSAWAEAGGSPQITTAPGKDVDFDTAYAAHMRGDFDQAILFYDKVARHGGISDWTTAVVLTNRGMAYLDKDQVDRAIADFDRSEERRVG